jgi:hypothetical protein
MMQTHPLLPKLKRLRLGGGNRLSLGDEPLMRGLTRVRPSLGLTLLPHRVLKGH